MSIRSDRRIGLDWIVFLHTFIFLAFWLTNLSFQQAVNEFLSDTTGLRLNYLLIFIIFTALVGLWSAIRLGLKRNARKVGPVWLSRLVGGFTLLFFYGSFIVLFLKNPLQVVRLGQFVQYFRLFVDATLLLLTAWGLRNWLGRQKNLWTKWLGAGLLYLLWLVPVFWTPGAVLRGPLPETPLLIANRGASMLAPENTLASMQKAADLGVYGLETDITISRDGVLFLMHDSTLVRTTNVAEIFPLRANDSADSFTWNELAQLNAGQWFVEQDPFGTIASGLVSPEQAALYRREPVPALADMLAILQANNLHFIYDLRFTSADHPFADQTLDLCLAEIKASGAAARTWVLVGPEDFLTVRAALPQAILSAGIDYSRAPAPQELVATGYQLVNSEVGLTNGLIQAYQRSGLWVNLWTVDEPWQYSRLWRFGADSVTSNNIHVLAGMSRPVMALSYSVYLVMWGLAGILAAALARSW
ncbi:MAG: glycerophosphodiester phosphodiesterase family protein [Chloroflexi bacterium]|nr:glycerophosphodiester phosphodiesterase family protein [Chloroflexota bacterium]